MKNLKSIICNSLKSCNYIIVISQLIKSVKLQKLKSCYLKKKSIKVMEIKVKQKNIKCFTKNVIKNYVELIMILKLIHICKSNGN